MKNIGRVILLIALFGCVIYLLPNAIDQSFKIGNYAEVKSK